MKWLKSAFSAKNIFALLGFVFQYCVPLFLFGAVIPYTHDGISAGLTKMGYVAIIVFLIICGKKMKEKVLAKPKSLARGLFLSLFPIIAWGVVNLCVDWIIGFIADFAAYWDKVIIFILIGRLFYTIHEAEASKNE